jgi:hypothetical protein
VKRIPCFIHVVTGDGRPLAGARIAVEQAEGPVPEMMYVTDDAGTAQIGLPPGRVVLRVFSGSKSSVTELVIGSEPGQTYDIHADAP